jgi:flagellar export protein FliJ
MKRFTFALDPALRLRKRAEEQAQEELAARRRALAKEQQQLSELQRELGRHEQLRAEMQRVSGSSSTPVNVQELQDSARYGQALMSTMFSQEGRVRAASQSEAVALQTANARRVDREALDRLRERRLEEHKLEGMRLEQEALDEAAVLRWRFR